MSRLQSGYSEDSNTTLTNADHRPTDLDELADYFNRLTLIACNFINVFFCFILKPILY